MHNLFTDIPASLPEELVQIMLQTDKLRIERIVSRGHIAPADGGWFQQSEHEWVVVIQGQATLDIEHAPTKDVEHKALHAGDTLFIPAGLRHRVSWTTSAQDTIWLAVFFQAGDAVST